MIFWILVGLLAAWVIFSIVHLTRSWHAYAIDYFFYILGGAFVAAVLFGLATIISVGVLSDNQPTGSTNVTHPLRALSTETSVDGKSYFLGAGTINGSRQISYMLDRGDYTTINAVDGKYAGIFEDEDDAPYLKQVTYRSDAWWLSPWSTELDLWIDQYEFHVPAGSIIDNDYTLSLK